MITCGWCSTHYTQWQSKCDSCGGPMPPQPGMELGEPPPSTPRKLPKGFRLRKLITGNIATILGGIFFLFGGLMTLLFLQANVWVALIPGFFALGGFFMLRVGLKEGFAVLHAFRDGIAVAGKVHSVSYDTTTKVNGKSPWKLTYHFQLDGQLHEGSVTTFDSTVSKRRSGQPLWVLHLPEDVEKNTIYPPVK